MSYTTSKKEMFTGIIEALGEVVTINKEQENVHYTLSSPFTNELKIDQSVAHEGVCLTVIAIENNTYTVTAIQETLNKTNLKNWKVGKKVNLERCMRLGERLDGHIVQGHVDKTGICTKIEQQEGSWKYTIAYTGSEITVEKGSVTLNGVSLTVVDSHNDSFSVCIIPFTYEHTSFHAINIGDEVNIEFDVIGKYVARLLQK